MIVMASIMIYPKNKSSVLPRFIPLLSYSFEFDIHRHWAWERIPKSS